MMHRDKIWFIGENRRLWKNYADFDVLDIRGIKHTYRPNDAPLLEIEPLPTGTIIRDFTWLGDGISGVVKQTVGVELVKNFKGIRLGTIKVSQRRKPKKSEKGKIIELPYNGPELAFLAITAWVDLDCQRSSVTRYVNECGEDDFKIHWKTSPPDDMPGFVISKKQLKGADFFGINDIHLNLFCTTKAKTFIEQKGYNNIKFRRFGEAV